MFYLEKIFQVLASSNVSLGDISPSAPLKPPHFTPGKTAVWVNGLWFLSFSTSLMCAMLATLQQQWAHRYITITQSRHSPHGRARIRAYLAEGQQNLRRQLPWMVGALPILLHFSLFSFLTGLVVYLYTIDQAVYQAVMWLLSQGVVLYVHVTLMPFFRHNSPYYTPLTSVIWCIYTGILFLFFKMLKWVTASNRFSHATHCRFSVLKDKYKRWLIHGVPKAAEESAQKISPELDGRAFLWVLESLDDDDKLEQFFASIPGFCGSKVVDDPMGLSIQPNRERLSLDLIGLMCRTLSSNFISDSVRIRRMKICLEAMETASLPITRGIFDALHQRSDWKGLLSSVEFGLFLKKANCNDRNTAYYSQLIVSTILANVQEHDARWLELAAGQLDIPGSVLNRYLSHGDSALLANCIHIIRCIVRDHSQPHCSLGSDSLGATLKSVSKFAVQDTLPELQHELCALWNEIVFSMWNGEDTLTRHASVTILSHVRHLYLGLHQDKNAGPCAFSASTPDHDDILHQRSTYRQCNIPGHRLDSASASPIPEVVISGTANASSASSFMFPYDDPALTTVTPTPPDADISSFLSPNLGYASAYLADTPSPLPGDTPATIPRFFPPAPILPHPAPLGSHHLPTAWTDPATSGVTHGTADISAISSTVYPVPRNSHSSSRAPSRTGKIATPTLPDALLSPIPIPAPSRAHPEDFPSHSDSATTWIRFGHNISHGLTSLSSATTSSLLPATSQLTAVLDGSRTLDTHDDARNTNLPIQVGTSRHSSQSELPSPGDFTKTSRPGSRNSSRESGNSPRGRRSQSHSR